MLRVRKTTAKGVLDVVEASYALGGTDVEWLAGVLDAAKPNFDLGRGFYAFTCTIDDGAFAMEPVYVERALDPKWGSLVEKLNREVPGAVIDVLTSSASICGGFGEVVGFDSPASQHLAEYGPATGITDAFTVFAQDGEGRGINISAPIDGIVATAPRVRGIWRRTSLHLAAGLRLRRKLIAEQAPLEAMIAPDGKVAHAEGAVKRSASARDALRQSVRRMERARTKSERSDPESALELWRALVAGEWSLVEKWESDGRRYLAAYRNAPDVRDPRALTKHESAVLRYVALGASNKEIAFTLGLPVGSIGTAVSQLLRKLGCHRRTELVALAKIDDAKRLGDDDLAILSIPARNGAKLNALSPAEREVAEQLVRGASNADIALARQTSAHTIANQIRRIFKKLGVQSRADLVHALTR